MSNKNYIQTGNFEPIHSKFMERLAEWSGGDTVAKTLFYMRDAMREATYDAYLIGVQDGWLNCQKNVLDIIDDERKEKE